MVEANLPMGVDLPADARAMTNATQIVKAYPSFRAGSVSWPASLDAR
jgi:hypothetical protein